jgi:hypothetical protein
MSELDTAERLTKIESALEFGFRAIDNRLEALEHRLFGNGQPGIIQEMREDISDLQAFRICHASESAFSWKLVGALLAGISVIITIAELIVHKKGGL